MDGYGEAMRAAAGAAAGALAARGLVLRGELRGVLAEVGRPETGAGLSAPVGDGLPAGWIERERRREEAFAALLAACERLVDHRTNGNLAALIFEAAAAIRKAKEGR